MADEVQVVDEGHAQTEFPTGGRREIIPGKGRFDLIPTEILRRLAAHFEAGAAKYADRNWEKGIPLSTYYNSQERHRLGILDRNEDEDHFAANVWNAVCMYQTYLWVKSGKLPPELDDRP